MTDETETVRLAGRDWPVPVLGVKQNRIVVPGIMKFMPRFLKIASALALKDSDPMWFAKIELTTEDFDLLCDVVYHGLLKGTPGLARNEFDNLPITTEELFTALPVMARQSGFLKPKAQSAESVQDDPPGEAQATVG